MATINGGRLVGAGAAIKQGGAVVLRAVVRVASAALGACRAGVMAFGVPAVRVVGSALGAIGRRVSIRWPARAADVSPWIAVNGPGESAGESVRDLPAVWLAVQYPAEYIGPNLVSLALARGEAWARVGNQMIIAGRVAIGESGGDVYFPDDAAARRYAALRYGAASVWLGVVAMGAGQGRDDLLSKRRNAVWVEARRAAKAVARVNDVARRRAMMADIDFALRGV